MLTIKLFSIRKVTIFRNLQGVEATKQVNTKKEDGKSNESISHLPRTTFYRLLNILTSIFAASARVALFNGLKYVTPFSSTPLITPNNDATFTLVTA